MPTITELGLAAKAASRATAALPSSEKNRALAEIAASLRSNADAVLAANAEDVARGRAAGMTDALVDRLTLTPARLDALAASVLDVAALPDPVGTVLGGSTNADGLRIEKLRVPLGVVGMIYEARPNVTVDAAVLCLKSGNAVVLRGGREARGSNAALVGVCRAALGRVGVPPDAIGFVEDTSHEVAAELMRCSLLDVLIPRGGRRLIETVVKTATVPTIQTGVGNCHVYVDDAADLDMAAKIIYNAKCSRPSVCNAAETLLVHRDAAERFLPLAKSRLDEKAVELRGCPRACAILPGIRAAADADWDEEYLDYILAVRIVDSLDDALAHIAAHTTGHSECIVTDSYAHAERFCAEVDAAAVYVNASTRFTDGGVFGLGAEIGISTQKLHARGPFGLEALTTSKYVIRGNGQIRQ